MLIGYKRGQTSVVLRVKLFDSSVSTGAGLTGLTSASSGLRIGTIADNESTATAYTVAGSTVESITTLGTFAAPTATKCRFKEVDSTNHPGIYELQIADARYAVSSAKSLLISLSGASNLAQCDVCIPLRDVDPYDSVRGGMTALPNAAAGASNGLPLSVDSSGRVDVLKVNGTSQTARDLGASVLLSVGTGTGQVNLSSGKVPATIAAGDLATDSITAAALKADAATEIGAACLTAFAGKVGALANDGSASLSLTAIAVNNPGGHGIDIQGGTSAIYAHSSAQQTILVTNTDGHGVSVTGGTDASASGMYVQSSGLGAIGIYADNSYLGPITNVAQDVYDSIAAAVRDVDNTSPAANSLGAAINNVSVTITPVVSTVSAGEVESDDVTAYQYAGFSFTFVIVDSTGAAVNLSGKTCKFVVFDYNATLAYQLTGTVGGASNNQVTVTGTDARTQTAGAWEYVLRNTTDDTVLAKGAMTVVRANDAT